LGSIEETPVGSGSGTEILHTLSVVENIIGAAVYVLVSVGKNSVRTRGIHIRDSPGNALGYILSGGVIDGRNGVSTLGGTRTIQSGSRRTGVVFVVRVSSEHSVGTGPLYGDTGLIVCNTLGIISSELSSARDHGIAEDAGVLDDADVREKVLSGSGNRSGGGRVGEYGGVGTGIGGEIKGTGIRFGHGSF